MGTAHAEVDRHIRARVALRIKICRPSAVIALTT